MQRPISGFHQDEQGDWVAELTCGHNQHVRHRPPFQERSWVLTEDRRRARLGTTLGCPLCDRAEPPAALRLVRTSPEWDERTLPTGLRRSHRLAEGTWGRILLRRGGLRFKMATAPPLETELAGLGSTQAIPPEIDHEVDPVGTVALVVEFYAVDRTSPDPGRPADGPKSATDQGGDPACWAGLVCEACGIILDGNPHRPGCPFAATPP